MKGFVYILKDSTGKFYIGSTDNIDRRLSQHEQGHTQTTRNMEKPELIFQQGYESIKVARQIERRLKSLKRKDYIEKIIADGYIRMTI